MFSFIKINNSNISLINDLKKKKRFIRKKKSKKKSNKSKLKSHIFLFIIFVILFIVGISLISYKLYNLYKYKQDDLTIVTAYYKIKSKFKAEVYYNWINNFVLLNKSIVFFSNKEFMPTLKQLRPKELHYKSVFIELEMEDFYSNITFYNDFKETFHRDPENKYHRVPLYLIWAEKASFVKKVILRNYFRSKCFYWVDAGYFRVNKNDMQKFVINNWPSTKQCFRDNRVLFGQVRSFSENEKKSIVNFDRYAHKRLKRKLNVIGGIFGGQKKNLLKFCDLYYDAIRLFIKNKLFIGKDQNIFTYVAFAHPDVVKLKKCREFFDFQSYLA